MEEKKHKCKFPGCEKEYNYSWHLKRHEKVHDESKLEICEICKARFTKKSNLRKHISSTHAKNLSDDMSKEAMDSILKCEPYTCDKDGCNRKFTTLGKLNLHKKKHEG
jgi:hypothetical protein